MQWIHLSQYFLQSYATLYHCHFFLNGTKYECHKDFKCCTDLCRQERAVRRCNQVQSLLGGTALRISYEGGPRILSRPRYRTFSSLSLSFSKQTPRVYITSGHDRFLPHRFKLLFTNHSAIRHYITVLLAASLNKQEIVCTCGNCQALSAILLVHSVLWVSSLVLVPT
jgi:hypothetical protein